MTAKQKQFCINYVQHYNCRKAYQDAFGCADSTANTEAYKLMKKDYIKEYIHNLEKEAFEQNGINAEHIANELAQIAFSKVNEEGRLSYADKMKALELLGKQLQLYSQKVELSNSEIVINITGDSDEG